MMTAMALTREVERGTIENLMAMPAQPHEIMVGKMRSLHRLWLSCRLP